MRARNLKPQFFKNELLATADPLYALTFAGLWGYVDREGRAEYRPTRIHLEINPGRAFERTVEALGWLIRQGFIVRYQVGKIAYFYIPKFSKHQNPHYKEPPSACPEPPMVEDETLGFDPDDGRGNPGHNGQSSDDDQSSVVEPEAHPATVGGKTRLTPDSGLLTPDSGSLTPPAPRATRARANDRDRDDEAEVQRLIQQDYPRGTNAPNWTLALHNAARLVSEGMATWRELLERVRTYARYVQAGESNVNVAAHNFFDPRKGFWSTDYSAPPVGRKADVVGQTLADLDRQIAAAEA